MLVQFTSSFEGSLVLHGSSSSDGLSEKQFTSSFGRSSVEGIELTEDKQGQVACGVCTFLNTRTAVVCTTCNSAFSDTTPQRPPSRNTGRATLGRDRHGEIRSDGRGREKGSRERGQEILPVPLGSNSRLEFRLGMSLQQAHDLLKQRAELRERESGFSPEATASGLKAVWPLEQQSMEIPQFLRGVMSCVVDTGALRYLRAVSACCGQAAAPGHSNGELGDFGGDKYLQAHAK